MPGLRGFGDGSETPRCSGSMHRLRVLPCVARVRSPVASDGGGSRAVGCYSTVVERVVVGADLSGQIGRSCCGVGSGGAEGGDRFGGLLDVT